MRAKRRPPRQCLRGRAYAAGIGTAYAERLKIGVSEFLPVAIGVAGLLARRGGGHRVTGATVRSSRRRGTLAGPGPILRAALDRRRLRGGGRSFDGTRRGCRGGHGGQRFACLNAI